MDKNHVILGGAAVAILIAVMAMGNSAPLAEVPEVKALVYQSEKFGFAMYYPEGYIVTERDAEGSAMRLHHVTVFTPDTPGNRDILEGRVTGGEGPPSITVDVIQNNLDQNSAEEWIKNSSVSNWKLSNGVIIPATINGVEALSYHSTGLYENDHAVFRHGDYIYMFTVSYQSLGDPIRRDFQGMVTSVQFK